MSDQHTPGHDELSDDESRRRRLFATVGRGDDEDRLPERIVAQWAQLRAERRAQPAFTTGPSNFSRAQVPWGLDLAAAWSWRLIVSVVAMLAGVVVVQQFEGHVLQPFLMGRFVSLHPLGVIVAIGCGVLVAGIAGALIAVPLAAAGNAVAQHLASYTDIGEDDPDDALDVDLATDGIPPDEVPEDDSPLAGPDAPDDENPDPKKEES